MNFFWRRKKEDTSQIKASKRALDELDVRARRDAKLRREINARLAVLQVELDNLTRRHGGKRA